MYTMWTCTVYTQSQKYDKDFWVNKNICRIMHNAKKKYKIVLEIHLGDMNGEENAYSAFNDRRRNGKKNLIKKITTLTIIIITIQIQQ